MGKTHVASHTLSQVSGEGKRRERQALFSLFMASPGKELLALLSVSLSSYLLWKHGISFPTDLADHKLLGT